MGSVTSVAFSPDRTRLASGSNDWTARTWDFATGQQTALFQGHEGSVTSVAISPDGTQLATGSDDRTARIWDLATGQEVSRLEGLGAGVTGVVFSLDGTRLAGFRDNIAWVWDLAAGQEIARLEGHENSVTSVAFSHSWHQRLTNAIRETPRRQSHKSGWRFAVWLIQGSKLREPWMTRRRYELTDHE
ncbi:WD40 repeat domain-containing protein, partial [Amaricoccus sp. W119]|uniref:WD40 repeat domain-containing protein n=1 Tax=Amaricoccus sp. W119 TaxID=3391833 RepID=UPI0039A6A5C2